MQHPEPRLLERVVLLGGARLLGAPLRLRQTQLMEQRVDVRGVVHKLLLITSPAR